MPKPIEEQVVVITGASSGIGRCTALYLGACGARIVVTARRAEALASLVGEIEDGGGAAMAVPGDVTRERDMEAVAHAAVQRFGRIDTWVNNAAVYIQGRVGEISLDEYRRVLEVDLIGVINGTKQALRIMAAQGSGVIVQVSSIVGKRGAAYASPYAAAKFGLEGFTESLRTELWGTGIQLSILYPPPIDTPIYQHARGKLGTMPKPVPPVSDPIEAARAIARLAETGDLYATFGLFRYLYFNLNRISPRFADWFLHHTRDFTRSELPTIGDNLDAPMRSFPPVIRAGWSTVGWRGFTLREIVRVLPVESMLGALAAGFVASRLLRRPRRSRRTPQGTSRRRRCH